MIKVQVTSIVFQSIVINEVEFFLFKKGGVGGGVGEVVVFANIYF